MNYFEQISWTFSAINILFFENLPNSLTFSDQIYVCVEKDHLNI